MQNENYTFPREQKELIDGLPTPICAFRINGGIPELACVSDGMCALLGFDREELARAEKEEACCWIHPDDRAELTALAERDGARPAALRVRTANSGYLRFSCAAGKKIVNGEKTLFLQLAPAEDRGEEPAKAGIKPAPETDGGDRLAKGRFDLTRNLVLSYKKDNESVFSPLAGQNYDEAVENFLSDPALVSDLRPLARALSRQTLLKRCAEGDNGEEIKFCQQRPDQLPEWMSLTIVTSVSPRTGHTECCTYIRDITDKTLEEQVFSRLPMLGFDVVGLLYIKTNACRYFRIKAMRPGALYEHIEDYYASIGEDIEKIVLPNQRDYVREGLRVETIVARLGESGVYPFSYSMTNREGKILQKLLQFSYLDDSRTTIFFCKSDITRQTESEHRQIQALAEAKLAAERANEAKSMFLSSMSHDLRTPLNGVIGFTGLAISAGDIQKKQEYLLKIKSSGELLLALVNDTLELSRIESGKYVLEPAEVDLRGLAWTVLTAVKPLADARGIELSSNLGGKDPDFVYTDKLKLEKVVLNLLSNSIKYTPAGGRVRLELSAGGPFAAGCNRRITVEDSGIGMEAEFLPHIFEPFSQEHRAEAANVVGTGLGLSIVKKTVDLMGGSIRVESSPGKGSKFTVDLPFTVSEGGGAAAEKTAVMVQLAGKKVLLCEDNYLNSEIASIILREKGMTVDCAQNGAEGLKMFRNSPAGGYDAVLMDIRMPVMDGYEAAAAIRALDRPDAASVPIIAMTADVFDGDMRRCREAGMNDFTSKPINPAELFRALGEAMKD